MHDKRIFAAAMAGLLVMPPVSGPIGLHGQRTYGRERWSRRKKIEAYKRQRAANRERRRLLAR